MNDPKSPTPPQPSASRRDFLKTAGVAAGAAFASSFIARSAYAAGSDELKLALIGGGGRGSDAARQALSTTGGTRLVAVADAFKDNARRAVENLKRQKEVEQKIDVPDDRTFAGFDAYQRALEVGPDVVVLATPPGFRPIHFEAAVKAGKHVFMEKPVAVDAPGVRQVLAAAEEAKRKNLKVGVGLQRHHDPKYIETIKRIQNGAIGDTTLLRVYWNGDTPWVRQRKPGQTEMEYQMRNWYFFNWLCGDHINEQHIHNLDVANWVKNGYPVACQGMGGRQVRTGPDHGEIYDHHMLEYVYDDGTIMLSQCRHQANTFKSVSEHCEGTNGFADISAGSITPRDGAAWRYRGPDAAPYQVEHDVLFDAIRNNKPFNEAENGAKSTMTAIMGRMASYSGQVIYWEDAIKSNLSLMPKKFDFDAPPPTVPDAEGRYPIPMPGKTKVYLPEEEPKEPRRWIYHRRGERGGR
jgi:predicted dehydrogenase